MVYILHATHGLEQISLREAYKFLKISSQQVFTKRILIETTASLPEVVALTTIEDAGILISHVHNEENTGFTTEAIIEQLKTHNWKETLNQLAEYRELHNTFSITPSLLHVSKVPKEELIEKVQHFFIEHLGYTFTPKSHENLDIRITADATDLFISVRINAKPLYERQYTKETQPGALRASIAASLVFLAKQHASEAKLVDLFCGSGTILCEAALQGMRISGSDISSDAVEITKKNLSIINPAALNNIHVFDALHTKWPDNTFNVAISNLPWDEKISVTSFQKMYQGALLEYKRILTPNATMVFLIKKSDLFIKLGKQVFPNKMISKMQLSFEGQNPVVVVIS